MADEVREEAGDATAQDLVGHGSANPSPGPNPATAFRNKVLLEHCHVYLSTRELWLPLCFFFSFLAWFQQRPYGQQNQKYLLSGSTEKVVDSC